MEADRGWAVVFIFVVALVGGAFGVRAEPIPDPAVRMDFQPAEYPHGYCEDQLRNVYALPLERYQAGMRPIGPCLPIGTWDAIDVRRSDE